MLLVVMCVAKFTVGADSGSVQADFGLSAVLDSIRLIESAIRLKDLLLFVVAAMFAVLSFELRAPRVELRLLFRRQN